MYCMYISLHKVHVRAVKGDMPPKYGLYATWPPLFVPLNEPLIYIMVISVMFVDLSPHLAIGKNNYKTELFINQLCYLGPHIVQSQEN